MQPFKPKLAFQGGSQSKKKSKNDILEILENETISLSSMEAKATRTGQRLLCFMQGK